jgi:peptidoglycan/LPS O-acetylase OafA/YrhL
MRASHAAPGLRYRPEVDGLRAIAVAPVILFHAGSDWFSGGYVGVDVFFVISGYLITSLLIEDLRRDRFSIARFYERRARRILPALFLVLLCTSVAAWMWMVPAQLEEYARTLVAVVLFVSNVYFWRVDDYFAPAAELNPLLHTWSLAVEEQFYIVFPLLLLLLWRLGAARAFGAIVLLSVMSLMLAEWGWRQKPVPSFFLLPTRAWELGVGAICAFVLRDSAPRGSTPLAGLGLALIGLAVLGFDAETPTPSLYTLAPVAGTALVILHARDGTLAARLLSVRLLVGLGLISYSAYLWHQPLFAFARVRSLSHPSPGLMLALVLASLGLAYLTWRFVEQPFRRTRAAPPSRRAVFIASGTAVAAFVAVGAWGQATDGRQQAWMAASLDRAHVYGLYREAMRIHGVYLDDGRCRFDVPALDEGIVERLRGCRERFGPGVAVLGDSHATDFFNGMDAVHGGPFLFGMTDGSCWMRSRPGRCDFEGFAALLRDHPGIFGLVVYHQAGYRFLQSTDGDAGPELLQEIPEHGRVPREELRFHDASVDSGLAYLAGLAEAAPVLWVGPRIEPRVGLNYLLRAGCRHAYALRPGQAELFGDLDRHLAGKAAAAGVPYASLIEATRLDMARDFTSCEHLYWRDGDHWSAEGAARFVGRFLAARPQGILSELDDGTALR